jgi:DNA-binding protein H-NS
LGEELDLSHYRQLILPLQPMPSPVWARAEAVLSIKSAIARHGITPQQPEFAGCFISAESEASPQQSARYMDAIGHVWDGPGVPDWLQRAINSGQTIEHFRVS